METALVRVNNDILVALDDHQSVILLLLDLSAAFDTVYHEILLNQLNHRFRICGLAISWFKSYLSKRMWKLEERSLPTSQTKPTLGAKLVPKKERQLVVKWRSLGKVFLVSENCMQGKEA